MEASHPNPADTNPPLPAGSALGYDPAKPVMRLGDLLDWPSESIVDPDATDAATASTTIARELRRRSSER